MLFISKAYTLTSCLSSIPIKSGVSDCFLVLVLLFCSVSWDGLNVKTATWSYFFSLDVPSGTLAGALDFAHFSECPPHVLEFICSQMTDGVTFQLSKS